MSSSIPVLYMEDIDPFDDNGDDEASLTSDITEESQSSMFYVLHKRVRKFNSELGHLTRCRRHQLGHSLQGGELEIQDEELHGMSLSITATRSLSEKSNDIYGGIRDTTLKGRYPRQNFHERDIRDEDEEMWYKYVEICGMEYVKVYLQDQFENPEIDPRFELVSDEVYRDPIAQNDIQTEFSDKYYKMVRYKQFVHPSILKLYDDLNLKKSANTYLQKQLFLLKPYYFQYNATTTEHVHKMKHKTTLSKLRIPNDYTHESQSLKRLIDSDSDRFGYYEWVSHNPRTTYEPKVKGESHVRHPMENLLALCPFCQKPCLLQIMNGEYKRHMVLNHGIFLNGMQVDDPDYLPKENLFICPYGECNHQSVRKGSGNSKERFQYYLWHVYEVHDRFQNYFL